MYNTRLCSVASYHTISKWPQRYRTPSNRKYHTFSERLRFLCLCMLSVQFQTLKFPDISQHDYQHIYTCSAYSRDRDNVSGGEAALKKSYIRS